MNPPAVIHMDGVRMCTYVGACVGMYMSVCNSVCGSGVYVHSAI